MTLASFVELYFNDREHHVRGTTMDTKRNIFDTKIVPLLGNRKMNESTAGVESKTMRAFLLQKIHRLYLCQRDR